MKRYFLKKRKDNDIKILAIQEKIGDVPRSAIPFLLEFEIGKKLGNVPHLFSLKFMYFRMAKSLSLIFEEIHYSHPEVTSSAPGRINIIGEHSDYNQGYALPAAINLRNYGPVCFIFWRGKKSKPCLNSKFYY